jgi:hypothetical protein
MPKKCSCKKLIGGAETETRLINGTDHNIDYMWITEYDSETWDYEVQLRKSVAPGNSLEIVMAEINYPFYVLIYDKEHEEYHEYQEFHEDDLESGWLLTDEKEVSQGKHGSNPESEYTGGSSKKSQSNRKERLRPKLKN